MSAMKASLVRSKGVTGVIFIPVGKGDVGAGVFNAALKGT
jgi:hypothetical protein